MGRKLTKENSLAINRPDLVKQWNYKKNNGLRPEDVSIYSHKKVWWHLPYHDPKTGKNFDFEWQTSVYNRSSGKGCPFIVGQAAWPTFNDLSTVNPNLASEWHPTKNKNLTPEQVTCGSGKKVWWLLPYDDPNTGKHFDFEWVAAIVDRNKGEGCPYLSNPTKAVWTGFNDLKTLSPYLSQEWDYEKNKNENITPENVSCGSDKAVWWKCEKGHSWKAKISNRYYQKTGCPHCSKELRTSFPEQVVYYYIKDLFKDAINGSKEVVSVELDVYIPSLQVAVEYDGRTWHQDVNKDIEKNLKCKEKGISIIRIREIGCPKMVSDEHCTIFEVKPSNESSLVDAIRKIANMLNKNIDVDINRDMIEIQNLINYTKKKDSLAELYQNLAKEWHPTKNGNLQPENVKAQSNKKVWWQCPYDDLRTGKHFDFEWKSRVSDRTIQGKGCPFLSNKKVWANFNDLITLNPKLASEWNYEKNRGLKNKRGEDISTPDKVTPGSHQKVWWKCQECGHEWEAKIENRNHGRSCPMCYKNKNSQNNED